MSQSVMETNRMPRHEMETRRLAAERMLRAGRMKHVEIADELHVSSTSVSRWAARIRSGVGMNAAIASGRPRRIPVAELRGLWQKKTTWTGREFAAAILDKVGVRYSADHCTTILRSLRRGRGASA